MALMTVWMIGFNECDVFAIDYSWFIKESKD